jgi:hypothetical protein
MEGCAASRPTFVFIALAAAACSRILSECRPRILHRARLGRRCGAIRSHERERRTCAKTYSPTTTALVRRAEELKILPLLYKDCEIPLFLADYKYADFREEKNYTEQIELLA